MFWPALTTPPITGGKADFQQKTSEGITRGILPMWIIPGD
jgi:hypothetical protein